MKVGEFSIAVAGFPEVHPRAESRASDLKYLKEKVDAGAVAIITQLFFDNEAYCRYVEDARKVGICVPIVPGILPILSASQIRRFTALCCAKIPPQLERELIKVEDSDEAAIQLGIDYATRQCEALIKFGVPGLHLLGAPHPGHAFDVHGNQDLRCTHHRLSIRKRPTVPASRAPVR